MEKVSCTKFCGVLINFQEVMKLQSFEFGWSDTIPAVKECTKYFTFDILSQPVFTWSKLTKETLEQGLKYVRGYVQ